MRRMLALVVWIAAQHSTGFAAPAAAAEIVPVADHHQHLMSPAAAALNAVPTLAPVELPADLARLLRERTQRYDDKNKLAELFTEDCIALDPFGPEWLRGRAEVAGHLSSIFTDRYEIVPVGYAADERTGHIVGYMKKVPSPPGKYFAHVQLGVRKGADGAWRIAAETPLYEGPPAAAPITGEHVVAQLDDAGMRRAAVLSVAYWFGSGLRATPVENEYAKVRAENDWVAQEVAKFPDRLVGFFSFNPLRDYALEELERCAKNPHLKGVKLHFGNSAVNLPRQPQHVAKLVQVFRAANARRLPLIVHLWTNPAYEKEGRQHAEIVLRDLLPAAPDVPIQIAHMAGGGRSTDAAMAVFAAAIAAKDSRTRNLYFDMATLTAGQSDAGLRQDAERMRQIGLDRFLFGSDMAPPNPPARRSWGTFRALMPLTDDEIRTIAGNVAPYMR